MRRPLISRRRLLTGAGLILVPVALAAGCRGVGPMACTEIGCSDGLNVELTGTLPAAFTVAVLDGDQVVGRVECPVAGNCGRHLFFENVDAETVQLVVTVGGDSHSYERTPEWRSTRPNGPGCDPVCRQASISIPIP